MRRLRSFAVLALAAAAGGCSCLVGSPEYRPVPGQTFGSTAAPAAAATAVPMAARSGVAKTDVARHVALAGADGTDVFGPRTAGRTEAGGPQAADRDPQKAFCYACMLAGGGHFYTGEKTKGAVLLGVAAAGVIGGALLSGESDDPFDCDYDPESFECKPKRNRAPLLVGAGVAAASWVYGIIDSRASAARVNARNAPQVGASLEMKPVMGLGRGGKPGAGVHFRVRW